jgi:hypothetical protein
MAFIIGSRHVFESKPLQYVAEASDLRLPPGEVPKVIETTIGDKQPFTLVHYSAQEFAYVQRSSGATLIVLND